jgi:hypothetical protein
MNESYVPRHARDVLVVCYQLALAGDVSSSVFLFYTFDHLICPLSSCTLTCFPACPGFSPTSGSLPLRPSSVTPPFICYHHGWREINVPVRHADAIHACSYTTDEQNVSHRYNLTPWPLGGVFYSSYLPLPPLYPWILISIR